MYSAAIDEKTLSELYGVNECTVLKAVDLIEEYADFNLSEVVIYVCTATNLDRHNYKHLLLIGHIIGVMSTDIFQDKLIKNINDICLRQN